MTLRVQGRQIERVHVVLGEQLELVVSSVVRDLWAHVDRRGACCAA